jgi:phosphoserine phosphatase
VQSVLTLIADPAGQPLARRQVAWAVACLEEAGAAAGAPDWLAPGIACDIGFAGIARDVADAAVRQFLCDQPLDIVAQPAAGRRKRLLVADMDSTIINVECIDELADYVGKRAEVAAITKRAMRGELDFVAALKARAAMLRGLDESVFAAIFAERVRANPGARALVATMRRHGAYTALVSGGFTEFTGRVREALGFDYDQANRLEVVDSSLTGQVLEPVLDSNAKLAALTRLAAERALPPDATLAVGDGANDVPMIQAAGIGVAYRAKPLVAAAAAARIDHGDLTALLYLQGYRRDEIAVD